MIPGLIELLVLALVLIVVYWAFHRLASVLGAPPVILVVVDIILVLVFLLAVLRWSGLVLPRG